VDVLVSITDAKSRLTQLVREAERGQSIVITRDDRPAAVLVSPTVYDEMRRQLAAVHLRRLRDGLTGSGLDALATYRESRSQLERDT
jgi:prevent-host-death family protein